MLRSLFSVNKTGRCFEPGQGRPLNLDDASDMRDYSALADDDAEAQDPVAEKRRRLNQSLSDLERKFAARSAELGDPSELPPISDNEAEANMSKFQRIKCIYGTIEEYLKTMYEAGETILDDAVITMDADLRALNPSNQESMRDVDFLQTFQQNMQDATAYMTRQMGLAKALLDKFIDLRLQIAIQHDRFVRIKETNSILRTLVDSQLRAALSPLFSTGVIMYTTIPVSLVEVMYNQFYQAEITVMPAFEKYKAVRQALTSSDPQHQYLVQANGLVFCTLEELVLKLPLGSTALDNSGVLAKYSTYFELSVKKLFDYISAYSYLSYSKQNGAADKVWEPTVAVRAPATDSPKSGFFELAPVSDAKTANPSRYAKCITVAVAASRQRKNVPFLILSYVQNVESALLVDALYNIVSGTNTSSAALLESLDKLYEEPDYIEDRAQKTFVHDLTNIPPLFATLYLRLLLAAIVLAPSATLTVADRVGTLAGVDAGVRDAYTKFLTKTKYVSTRRSQRNDLVFETNKLIVNFENVVGADDQDLTVKPEFFTDLVNLAEFPRISDYIVPAANARANSAKSSSGEMLFSRASQKSALAASSFQGANNGLLGRIALLHTVGSGLGHLIVAANHLVSPPNSSVYTMHPLVMDLRQLVINFS